MAQQPEFVFLTAGSVLRAPEGALSSPSTLVESRTLGPMLGLRQLGYEALAYSLLVEPEAAQPLCRAARFVIFGDLAAASDQAAAASRYRALIAAMGGAAATIFDVAQAPSSADAAAYAGFLAGGARVTAGSEHAAKALAQITGREAEVVPEPYFGRPAQPWARRVPRRWKAFDRLAALAGLSLDDWRIRLLWNGDLGAIDGIVQLYPELARLARDVPMSLRCIAPAGAALDTLADQLHESDPEALRLAFEAQSPAAIAHARLTSDVVLLPGGGAAGAGLATRLIAAILAGRLAVAQPSPYFGALAAYACVGDDIGAGMRWALSNPRLAVQKLGEGQAYLERTHAPALVARTWVDVLTRKK